MLKENDRVVWRHKGNKMYSDVFIIEINRKMLQVSNAFGIRHWLNSEEVEIEVLEKVSHTTRLSCIYYS